VKLAHKENGAMMHLLLRTNKSKLLLLLGYRTTYRSQPTELTDKTGSKAQKVAPQRMRRYNLPSTSGLKLTALHWLALLEAMAAMVLMVGMAAMVAMVVTVLLVLLVPTALVWHWWNSATIRLSS
jgi:Flp pilus assembly protein TadB